MLLAFTLALGACQASSTQPVVGTRSGVVAAGRDDLMSMKATAMINAVLYRYTIAWDRQGMSGVVDAITDCYRSAIMPGSEPQDVRNCLVLDMMAFRIDHQVSGGPPGGPRQLPFFQRDQAGRRWERYAPLGNLVPGTDAASFMKNGSDAALLELERRRRAPRRT